MPAMINELGTSESESIFTVTDFVVIFLVRRFDNRFCCP